MRRVDRKEKKGRSLIKLDTLDGVSSPHPVYLAIAQKFPKMSHNDSQ